MDRLKTTPPLAGGSTKGSRELYPEGVMGDPVVATAALGEQCYEAAVGGILRIIGEARGEIAVDPGAAAPDMLF